ncbi:hypothetical protein HDV04_005146 [Boothiomyces sp. JEL0838]|nr:hypothetical protein HDV04_005146 [Boothiomyces sp. JEL0838]
MNLFQQKHLEKEQQKLGQNSLTIKVLFDLEKQIEKESLALFDQLQEYKENTRKYLKLKQELNSKIKEFGDLQNIQSVIERDLLEATLVMKKL